MNKKTLGGERLGSGNKMQVELHGFERSTHDLSYIWRSTMSAGTLVPFMNEIALPGDTFDVRLNCDIKTHPTIGPLFGSYKVQLDTFIVPMRLYHSALHNNRLNVGMNMSQIKFPNFTLYAPAIVTSSGSFVDDPDTYQVNPSCILHYLGIRGVGATIQGASGVAYREFNAIPWLAYWDIFKQYYSNKQEELAYVIHNGYNVQARTITGGLVGANSVQQYPNEGSTPQGYSDILTLSVTGSAPLFSQVVVYLHGYGRRLLTDVYATLATPPSQMICTNHFTDKYGSTLFIKYWDYANAEELSTQPPILQSFPLEQIDTMRELILARTWNATFNVNTDATGVQPYNYLLEFIENENGLMAAIQGNQEGLAVKTYQSDLLNNWLSTEWIDGTGGINEITAIDTSGGSFNIDTLNLSKKVYDMLNRIAVSGGTYQDWLDAVYDHEAWNRPESPVYCGGLIKELVFQEVVSNAAAEDGSTEQPLGTLAGKGVMSSKHKGGDVIIKVNEPSIIMGIISLTPRLDYSQGNKWFVETLVTMDDLHKPSLDQIGFQELIQEQMAYWSTNLRVTVTPPSVFWEKYSAGKQPAWINYMTNINETHGNFAYKNNEMFMTLNRKYEYEWDGVDTVQIKDLTTYIDPSKFNHIFAQTSLDAQNFWAQISVDMIARRKMSAKVMPNL